MHAVCPTLLILLCLITTTRSVPLIVSLNTAAVTGYPADTGILYEIAAVFGGTISGTHPWRRARYSKLLVMCYVQAPDVFFSIVSKVPILSSQRVSRNFRNSVLSRLHLVLYYRFTLPRKELLR